MLKFFVNEFCIVSYQVLSVATPERRPEPIRIKAKGLLERRGSSASLTIELAPAPESPPHMVTPTRECTAEEFLLSAGNVLSRMQLKKAIKDPASLHKEFWEVPLNVPEKIEIFGSGVKNRYSGVLPNESSRVVLSGIEDPVASYINANYIRVSFCARIINNVRNTAVGIKNCKQLIFE